MEGPADSESTENRGPCGSFDFSGQESRVKRKQPRFNVYCLQVSFCILFVWVVVSNVILYIVFPPEGPSTTHHHRSSSPEHDDGVAIVIRSVDNIVQGFLDAMKSISSDSQLILVQPQILQTWVAEPTKFEWKEFVLENDRTVTFITNGHALPSCSKMEEVSRAVGGQLLCMIDGSQIKIASQALNFLLIATKLTSFGSLQSSESLPTDQSSLISYTSCRDSGGIIQFAVGQINPRKLVTMDGIAVRIPANPSSFIRNLPYACYIPCNSSATTEFFDNNPKMRELANSSEGIEFRVKSRQILLQASKALNSLHIPFWISSGTLLGWRRQCDVIPYSKDMDIGIFISDFHHDLIWRMEEEGLQLKLIFGTVERSLQYSFYHKDVKLDVYFFYETNGGYWNGATKPETGERFKYDFPSFSLCWSEFMDLPVRVPCPTDQYIEANYGLDWFSPMENWDWRHSPPNSAADGRWSDEEMKDFVQVFDHYSMNSVGVTHEEM